MDFAWHYTPAQEAFRQKVREWLAKHAPRVKLPPDPRELTEEHFRIGVEFRRKLGEKGWLAPTWPKKYGGGGLSEAEARILEEELSAIEVPPTGDLGRIICAPAIFVHGTPEQKERFLPPILRGEVVTWQVFTESEAGSDLSAVQTRAVRDGDEYIVTGQKRFVGSQFTADYLFTLVNTDPHGPRYENLSVFLIPANLPGITMEHIELIAEGGKRVITFNDVRVPREYLIGQENQGWWIAQTTPEFEEGGSVMENSGRLMQRALEYVKMTHFSDPLSKDPFVQEIIADLYIESQIGRLFGLRNYYMRTAGKKLSHEGSQASLHGKYTAPKQARGMLQIFGPYALIKNPKWAPLRGELENQQRQGLSTHPGGTPEVQKLIMARRMGLSRTRGEAAETPRF